MMENTYYIGTTHKCGKGIFTSRSIKKDETIFTICGGVTSSPSIYTVPIDYNLFIDTHPPGKYLNHSCEPTCGIRNRTEVVAMRELNKDDEITIDYAMIVHDYDQKRLQQDIKCLCSTPNCRGRFGSYKHLSDELKQKYSGYISDYMLNG